MQKTSLTEAGQANSGAPNSDLIDAINQVFGLFRINFHNQYYKAFPDADTLNPVKKLWLESLQRFSSETILLGAKRIIESSEYLPTLNKMISTCDTLSGDGAPDAHSAYLEACRASSPKHAHAWSHPAIYHAGKASDWYFLATTTEKTAFPIFRNHYKRLVDEMQGGAHLLIPQRIAEPASTEEEMLGRAEARAKLSAIKDELQN